MTPLLGLKTVLRGQILAEREYRGRALSGCTSCSVVEISDYLGNREAVGISMCLMERNFWASLLPKYILSFFKGPGSKRRKKASVGICCRSFLEFQVDLA